MFRKFCSVLCVLLGIAVMIFGYKMTNEAVDHAEVLRTYSYDANSYYTLSASFGGDFYTYMYRASDTMVDELDDINHAIETIIGAEGNIQRQVTANVKATDSLTRAVYMLIIAVGCGIFAVGLCNMGAAFTKEHGYYE